MRDMTHLRFVIQSQVWHDSFTFLFEEKRSLIAEEYESR